MDRALVSLVGQRVYCVCSQRSKLEFCLLPFMAKISEGGEEQCEELLIHIFLPKLKIRAGEKRSRCGPGWLDAGVGGGACGQKRE